MNHKQEQFETHMENLAEELKPILDNHFQNSSLDKQVIFACGFILTEYFLEKGFEIENIESLIHWGMKSKNMDWKNSRSL